MNPYIVRFDQLRQDQLPQVGAKHALLGELIGLADPSIRVPSGFATTAQAYRLFLAHNQLQQRIDQRLAIAEIDQIDSLAAAGDEIRSWLLEAELPQNLVEQLGQAWNELVRHNDNLELPVAVRASAVAQDLPEASFAGQQQSFVNVCGLEQVLTTLKQVYASLFSDRAIAYRVHRRIGHDEVALSVGVQLMVSSETGSSGVLTSQDADSGSDQLFYIGSVFGLGQPVIEGRVNPDEFLLSKKLLAQYKPAILSRSLGTKAIKMVHAPKGDSQQRVVTVKTDPEQRAQFSLADEQLVELARLGATIETYFGYPIELEWARDGGDGELYILQVRRLQIQHRNPQQMERYLIRDQGRILLEGRSIGQRIGSGPVRIVRDRSDLSLIEEGDVLVTDMTDPEWEPVLRRLSAIITNRGGRTCHAALIARELGIPAIVGCSNATELLDEGQVVTVSCAEGDQGRCYQGRLDFEHHSSRVDLLPQLPLKMMLNVANPDRAFMISGLPNQGIGLARLEFIIARMIGIHPKALLHYDDQSAEVRRSIELRSAGYGSPREFFVAKLIEGIATLAVASEGKPVIVRLSDFKSNEYRNLIGGRQYELNEENPMLGFRGASRYVSDSFRPCFELECQAIRYVREQMGLANIEILVPFVRTLGEARQVISLLEGQGLKRGVDGLRVLMMCELPANALLADQFLEYFDGFSIGSNDLTQLTLGLDRDSGVVAHLFDERNEAVKALLTMAIQACKRAEKYVGVCGQAPSDYQDMASWLMEQGIDSLSLNPDVLLDSWLSLAKAVEPEQL